MTGRILVLDDEENYAEMLQDLLLQNNYRVDMVTRPERAIDRLEEIRYDLVVSDYKMPVMDGADFLRKAREIYPNLPFILVSGLMNTPELVKVANMSVTLVLEKPLDTDHFLEQVRRFSEPMSEEEAKAYRESGVGRVEETETGGLPGQPRFYSARCRASNRFLQKLWNLSNQHRLVLVIDPPGGDAELAVRDISQWKTSGDGAVERIGLSRIVGGEGASLLQKIIGADNKGRVVSLTGEDLSAEEFCRDLRRLETEILPVMEGGEALLLVVVLAGPAAGEGSDEELLQAFGDRMVTNPALRFRLPDLAAYVRDLVGSSGPGVPLAPEAIFALLSHPWPHNRVELEAVLGEARSAVDAGGAVSLEALRRALGAEAPFPEASAGERLATFLRARQADALRRELERGDNDARQLARQFGIPAEQFDPAAPLEEIPLLNPELGRL